MADGKLTKPQIRELVRRHDHSLLPDAGRPPMAHGGQLVCRNLRRAGMLDKSNDLTTEGSVVAILNGGKVPEGVEKWAEGALQLHAERNGEEFRDNLEAVPDGDYNALEAFARELAG